MSCFNVEKKEILFVTDDISFARTDSKTYSYGTDRAKCFSSNQTGRKISKGAWG